MKTSLKKRRKYAFNINECNIKKKIKASLKDFQKLNRGIYDEIESNDLSIKKSKKMLKDLKNSTVKELAYSNAKIPDHWKTKLDYSHDLIKMFLKDPNFLFYLGKGGDSRENPHIHSTKETIHNIFSYNAFNKTPPTKKIFQKIEDNSYNNNNNTKLNSMKNKKSNKNLLRTERLKGISDKEIFGLLDEFKHAYPLLDKEKSQIINHLFDFVLLQQSFHFFFPFLRQLHI
jgi:hypothetical protein